MRTVEPASPLRRALETRFESTHAKRSASTLTGTSSPDRSSTSRSPDSRATSWKGMSQSRTRAHRSTVSSTNCKAEGLMRAISINCRATVRKRAASCPTVSTSMDISSSSWPCRAIRSAASPSDCMGVLSSCEIQSIISDRSTSRRRFSVTSLKRKTCPVTTPLPVSSSRRRAA